MFIESRNNKIYREALELKEKNARDQKGLFLVEGKKQISEIDGGWRARALFVSKDYKGTVPENSFVLPPKLFDKLSSTKTPQGIIAAVEKRVYDAQEILRQNGFFLILENIQDPGNLGAIIRSAHAFGAKGVFISKGSADIYSSKAARSTMGSIFKVPFINDIDCRDIMKIMKQEKIQTLAASLKGKDLSQMPAFKGKIALIIGNEGGGIQEETERASDFCVKIQMKGGAQSLNAAAAASIIMYELSKNT
ncbi:MAG: RNA methyltransferase [Endomicrobium sp.]|nr:RNA methyltransferase [Endomicrobium sp.]